MSVDEEEKLEMDEAEAELNNIASEAEFDLPQEMPDVDQEEPADPVKENTPPEPKPIK
jgi:hypothetical protein